MRTGALKSGRLVSRGARALTMHGAREHVRAKELRLCMDPIGVSLAAAGFIGPLRRIEKSDHFKATAFIRRFLVRWAYLHWKKIRPYLCGINSI